MDAYFIPTYDRPVAAWPAHALRRAVCTLFGHRLDARPAARGRPGQACRCGAAILPDDGGETRTRHVLSCFFRHHRYVKAGEREGHNEYMCVVCGHPLLFPTASDPYAGRGFTKRVRYLCNLLGHRVHAVTRRQGMSEYACHCGHSFLRAAHGLTTVQHPLACLFLGHFVRFVERRGAWSEFLCRHCGHTFGVADRAA